MAENVTLTINGQAVEVPSGTLIVEAAKKLGIVIPTFCYDNRLRSVGACRMCLVEVEKSPKLVASCATPVAPGMVVKTDSERVLKAQKGVLEFLLINHPLDCPTCDKGGECPLQNMTYGYGPTVSRYRENKIRFIEDINQKFDEVSLGPEIVLNRNRCIMCFKCVRIVRELAGEADLGVFKRGAFARISTLNELAFADEFSGNTVENCPVGALLSRSFRYKIRNWLLKSAPSVCNLCPVGCNINIDWSGGKVYRHMSRPNHAVDDGWLCDRGRYSFDITQAPDRVVKPHIKRGLSLEPCSWDEAIMLVSMHLRKIIDQNRGQEVAAVGSPLLANEEAYAIRNFFGDIIKTADIDFQTDLARPLEPELIDLVGLDGTIEDLEKDAVFIFAGCDPGVEQPVAALRIKKAVSGNGARAIFIGSYDKRLGNFPVENLRIPFGAEPEALDSLTACLSGEKGAGEAGLDSLSGIADQIRNATNIHIISGRGFFNHPRRRQFLASLFALKKAAKAKLSILPTQGNFIGVSHFGLYGEPEHSFTSILTRIDSGEIKTLFAFGSNPVDEYPDRKYALETLKKLEFFIVVAPFMNSTASLASVVFPQAMLPDYGGSFVNIEGRIQRFEPMDERRRLNIRPVWGILGDISSIMEIGPVWYSDSQVREDIANKLKDLEKLTALPPQGLMFPFLNQFSFEPQPTPAKTLQAPPADQPYILQCLPSVLHNGWLTERSENLMRLSGQQAVMLHPDDAARENIEDGQAALLTNCNGAMSLPAKITPHVNRGEVLIINSFGDNRVNSLMDKDKLTTYISVKKA